jgi:glycosyltransferase involved in cell wall biosynthesis
MRALESRGHTVVWPAQIGTDTPLRELFNCDLVHSYRRSERIGDFRKLSERGVAVSFDNDDNFAASEFSEKGQGLQGHLFNKRVFASMMQVAKMADLTTTPSPVLADTYRSAGAREVAVIENHLDRNMFGFGSKSKHAGVVVGWIAGGEHAVDLERIGITDALTRLLDVHPDLRVRTVGVRLPLRSERYEHVAEIEFREILKFTGEIDIGIAPLSDTVFNRSRSSAKLKEYSSGGTAWLASPVGPYLGLDAKQGGRLVGDDEWFTALDELISHPRKRKRLARNALKWAKSQTIDHFASTWESSFTSAIERAQGRMRPRPGADR